MSIYLPDDERMRTSMGGTSVGDARYSLNAESIPVDPDVAGQSARVWADVGAISEFASQAQANSNRSLAALELFSSTVASAMNVSNLLTTIRWLVLSINCQIHIPSFSIVVNWLSSIPAYSVDVLRLLDDVQTVLSSITPSMSTLELLGLYQWIAGPALPSEPVAPVPTPCESMNITSPVDSLATSCSSDVCNPSDGNKYLPCKFSCTISHTDGGCAGFIKVPPRTKVKSAVTAHMHAHHGISSSDPFVCSWFGCTCPPQSRRDECADFPDPHPAHGADLSDHIVKCHLELRHACNKCSRAQWKSESAMKRHRKECPGKIAVVCAGCLARFESEAAMDRHVEECPATLRA